MPTTTIRIEDALKARITAAAKRAGKKPHAFILDVIARSVEQDEQEAEQHRLADERWATLLRTGQSVAWDEAKVWLEARAGGKDRPRPGKRTPVR